MCFTIPPFSPSYLLKGTKYIWRSTDQRNGVLCLDYSDEQWFSENSISVPYFIGNEYFYANECNRSNHIVICSECSFACLYSTSVCNLQEIFVCIPRTNWGLNMPGKAMLVWHSQFWRLCPACMALMWMLSLSQRIHL